jgi:hypothetical protein
MKFRKEPAPGDRWRLMVRCAIRELQIRRGRLASWYGLWSSPFYKAVRTFILNRPDATMIYRAKDEALSYRLDRIAWRYRR